ncbi:MAG TPA: methyltransferase domain-containing protein [Hungateiclostridium thermocellum]|jgi:pseudaminic acid biosynthesis-associated methylase|uniref:Pseudaminic acid biosynthesis-associated methylase n=2 Tax=Acetivibrio thermocellus TaxID=1515 RepID=A3DHK4_ACET2|nr:pseudaminic acid biosynthesis-associated methylase [Acetivibrio thermocellus]ABN53433.1 pseudaminic acid biosynthesis-associated methylase [Acetivibrio thermocellus ATCC 27405]ADU75884.1 pseudaminic acid biosynthesis-associated methylase [Acetivibrio thermocellus DSM 1313]ALX09916.1 pseudaminic acid biosynthesis-associated methylase [Acetivibrio thermocellus AD2]ANV77690.1 pseudaminic acid biosynthesis-associated methylase [Acetivibrio thermocellus DSM 2360]EIC03887.1 pseudaminic acid biosy
MMTNLQEKTWAGQFGKDYTDRCTFSPEELDSLYKREYGISREEMNTRFLSGLGLENKRILEVGCNVGNQLRMLQRMGFNNLYGIELQQYAIEKAKALTKRINIIHGVADDIPFKDGYFDMVFTSGVLIHISPGNINRVLDEIYRCSREYIWGFEYYADDYTEVNYRGHESLLWKTNFPKLYLDRFPELELVKEEKFKYLYNDNVDVMFLLRKRK